MYDADSAWENIVLVLLIFQVELWVLIQIRKNVFIENAVQDRFAGSCDRCCCIVMRYGGRVFYREEDANV